MIIARIMSSCRHPSIANAHAIRTFDKVTKVDGARPVWPHRVDLDGARLWHRDASNADVRRFCGDEDAPNNGRPYGTATIRAVRTYSRAGALFSGDRKAAVANS
jgi:hypothetical protein